MAYIIAWFSTLINKILDKGSKGAIKPEWFKVAKVYHKKNNQVLTMGLMGIIAAFLVVGIYRSLVRPVVIKGCTWILTDSSAMDRENRRIAVEAQVVATGTMTKRIQTVGKLTANASVTIRSEVHGRIKKIAFVAGTFVKKGDLLIQLEDDDVRAEVQQAEADLVLRKADYDRSIQLRKQAVGSIKDFDKAQAEYNVAEARLAKAKANLAKMSIVAPFEGNIGLIHFNEGAYVQANQELVSLVDTTPIKIDFNVPERYVNDVGVGQVAFIQVQALGDRSFEARVTAVDSKINTDNHSLALQAEVPNDSGMLKPGSFATVSLVVGEKGDTLMVDEAAVEREGNIEFVWVVEKGRAVRERILTGVRENQKIEIVAGLRAGMIVVVAGQNRLQEGSLVSIKNMTEEDIANALKTKKKDIAKESEKESEKKAEDDKPSEKKDEEKKDLKASETVTETKEKEVDQAKPSAVPESNLANEAK